MPSIRLSPTITACLALASLSTGGCAEKQTVAAAVPPSTQTEATPTTRGTAIEKVAVNAGSVAAKSDAASARWSDIRDYNFDARAEFFAGLTRLEAKVEAQIAELKAKRAAMKSTASANDWDFAMKEMDNARTYLKSTREELSKASADTWAQQKDKVGQAWVRTQDAYAKVNSSTTG